MKSNTCAAGLAAILMLGASAASAAPQNGKQYQSSVNTSAPATYDTFRLSSGFTPDPYVINVTSGGGLNAADVSSGCVGTIAIAPDAQLTYDAGSLPLMIATESNADTTLVVNGPDGRWYCDDDSGDGSNALLNFSDPMSGVYDIYVGAYGGNSASATIYISEIARTSSSNQGGDGSLVDPSLNANFGTLDLRSGFQPDPQRVDVYSGGAISASNVSSGCSGFISNAPDVEVSYSAGSLPLIFSVNGGNDTTLVINGPDGRWYCDDDSGNGALNPSVRFNNPMSGVYDVWVGSYSSGGGSSSTLSVSELYTE